MKKLKELRRRRALSARELAQLAGIGYGTIYRVERGHTEAQPRTVRKLAKALGVEPIELLSDE